MASEPADFVERLSRASAALAGLEVEAVGRMLAAELPEVLTGIARDRSCAAFARWGLSTVLDENLGTAVIGRPLFEALHAAAGLGAAWPLGNAGVLHVYGYLLSSLPTPFGLKRERWLGDELTAALGLPAGAFVDVLCGPVAGRQVPGGQVAGRQVTGGPGLARFVADTVEERVDAADVVIDEFAGEEREEVFRAVYLERHGAADGASRDPRASHAGGDAGGRRITGGAVAYLELLGGTRRLVTVFPVAASADEWLAGFTADAPRLRYNAAAHELPPRSALAARRITRRP